MEENERTKRTTANTAVRTAGSPHMPGRGFSCGVPLRLTVRKENDRRQTSLFGGAGEERVRNVEAGVVGREGGEEARRTKGHTTGEFTETPGNWCFLIVFRSNNQKTNQLPSRSVNSPESSWEEERLPPPQIQREGTREKDEADGPGETGRMQTFLRASFQRREDPPESEERRRVTRAGGRRRSDG